MKNTKPSAEKPLSSTIRDDGCPSAETVATTIAFGSYSPAACASSNHAGEHGHRVGGQLGLVEAAVGVLAPQPGHVFAHEVETRR